MENLLNLVVNFKVAGKKNQPDWRNFNVLAVFGYMFRIRGRLNKSNSGIFDDEKNCVISWI